VQSLPCRSLQNQAKQSKKISFGRCAISMCYFIGLYSTVKASGQHWPLTMAADNRLHIARGMLVSDLFLLECFARAGPACQSRPHPSSWT
jgi:hypothetical protein